MALDNNIEVDTTRAIEYHWLVLKVFGLDPPKRGSKWFKPYIAGTVILNLTLLLFPLSLIINVALSQNMMELCENLYNTITALTCNIKFVNILMIRHKMLKVRNILERLDARARTQRDMSILEEGIAAAKKLFLFFVRLYMCAVMTSQLIVYFSSERILMYPAWFPWNYKASKRNYLFAYSYQLYALILHTIQNMVNDTYPAAYLIIMSAQVKALASRITHLGSNSTSSEETLYGKLKDCIKDHNTIHELFVSVQEMISGICLAQFVSTCLAQCTMGVHIIYVGTQPSKLLNLFMYLTAITMEIFILCYYGDLYCQANDHLTESIYDCNWIDRDEKFKKAFLFLLQRSQMPTTLMAGNLIPVRMPTFVKIIKTAYSVFTVLNETK